MAKDDPKKDPDQLESIKHLRSEPRPDFTQPLPRTRLPSELQKSLDDDQSYWTAITEGKGGDSTESNVRYAAYATRFRTILLATQRYVAYTSEIGESFRPVAHPNMVRAAYGISWAYIIGDVSNEGYKAYKRNQKVLHPELPALSSGSSSPQTSVQLPGKVAPIDHWGTVVAERAIFQTLASMALPAFTIHSIVRYSGQAMKNIKNVRIRTWSPVALGLAAVPALPYLFDKPIENATEWVFHKGFEMVGGPDAVGHRSAEKTVEVKTGRRKDKEL